MMKMMNEESWTGRKKMFAVGLGVALALTLAAVAALNPEVELASAQAPSANGQEAPVEVTKQKPVGETFKRTELYFGSEKPDGSEVTEQDFEDFVDDKVTPRFPDGLTVLTGDGQFRGSDGVIVEERSFVLILLYPPKDKKANGEIEKIRTDYKTEFEQESVLRADSRERVSF